MQRQEMQRARMEAGQRVRALLVLMEPMEGQIDYQFPADLVQYLHKSFHLSLE